MSKLFEDAADNCRFAVIDAPFAAHRFAGGIEFPDHVITKAEATSRLALTHAAFQPTSGFLGEILQEQGVHGALEADMQFTDLSLRQGYQSHAGKGKLLEQAGYILLIARETIEGLGNENFKTTRSGILEHLLVARSQGGGAADGMVRVHRL